VPLSAVREGTVNAQGKAVMRTRFLFCLWLGGAAFAQKPLPDPESVLLIESIQGPALYREYCAVCHGLDGKGDGPMAASLKTRPADLTRIAGPGRSDFPLDRVEKVISGAEAVRKGHGTKEMPVWGPVFSQIAWDQDLGRVRIHNLALYLKAMQRK